MSQTTAERKRAWRERMRQQGRCLQCASFLPDDAPSATSCAACLQARRDGARARHAVKVERMRALGLQVRPRGAGGFGDHPEHRHPGVSGAEAVERGRLGGLESGRRRYSGAKWKTIEHVHAAITRGETPWTVYADFYDLVYARGLGAGKEQRRRAKTSEAA